MPMKILKPGEDFHFDKDFGFTESHVGGHPPKDHNSTEADDGSYVSRMKRAEGGHAKRRNYDVGGPVGPLGNQQGGNPMAQAQISMPIGAAKQAAAQLQAQGARGAIQGLANAARRSISGATPGASPNAPQAASPIAQAPSGMGPAAPPQTGPMGRPQTAMKKGGHLTTKERHNLPAKDFALPGERYPVEDKNHARNALARVSQHGTPSEKAEVRAKVHSKYPDIGKKKES